jgi:thiol-disulfide isomerase/thioredoxin
MLAGLVALAGTRAAGAAPSSQRLFDGTPLANNFMALLFERVSVPLPADRVMDERGATSLSKLRGRTTILSLWAEWCVPCLLEARDLAALRRKYANGRFDIVSLLTSSKKPLDYRGAHERLATMAAGDLPLLIEPNGGKKILAALSSGPRTGPLAALPSGGALPCTLLIDPSGRVRGRSFGAPVVATMRALRAGAGPQTLTEEDKRNMMGGDVHTAWTTAQGDALARTLASGLLEKMR